MDLDDLDGPSKVPSRTFKFEPKSFKINPQPRRKTQSEPQLSKQGFQDSALKSEPEESILAASIPDPQNTSGSWKNQDDEETKDVEVVGKFDDPMDEDTQEEEDPIVREIDVFFNPSIDSDTQLYVLQYPLRPRWRPYELDERCKEVRVKPISSEMQLDLSMDDSTNWDHAQAKKFNFEKQTLSSSSSMQPLSSRYAVGVLIGDKLHLNPIHAIVQLRPSLEHVDSVDSNRKKNATCNTGAAIKLEDPNEGKPSSSKKQVKCIEVENDQILEAEECWIPLKYHGSKSELSSRYLQKMVAQQNSKIEFAMNPYDYLSSLCPGPSNDYKKSKGASRRFLLSLTLEERVKKLLLEGPPVQRFSVLKHYAQDCTSEDLLTVLQRHGVLVQGLWAPHTKLLFPDEKESAKSRARDYILSLFSKSPIINSSQINFSANKENFMSFLNNFAVERPSLRDWKFKEHKDQAFIKLHPEIVRRQEETWQRIWISLKPYFDATMKRSIAKPSATHDHAKQLNSEKNTLKTASGCRVLTKTTITAETREALLKTVPKVIQNYKVCSFQLICQGLRDLAISQSSLPKADPRIHVLAASGADAPPEELNEIIGQVATNIHGFYVLKSSPDNPQYDSLRKIVIDLLLARGPNAKLKKVEVLEAAKLALKRDVTDIEYKKVMTDFCEFKSSAWVLKRGEVFRGFGSSYGSLDLKVRK